MIDMVLDSPSGVPAVVVAAIGWIYVVTNAARVLTYVPQIVAVWRCNDGARSISLLTWGSWMVSHLAAIAYGALVVHDMFFMTVSAINFSCCTAVTSIAWQRRRRRMRKEAIGPVAGALRPRGE